MILKLSKKKKRKKKKKMKKKKKKAKHSYRKQTTKITAQQAVALSTSVQTVALQSISLLSAHSLKLLVNERLLHFLNNRY